MLNRKSGRFVSISGVTGDDYKCTIKDELPHSMLNAIDTDFEYHFAFNDEEMPGPKFGMRRGHVALEATIQQPFLRSDAFGGITSAMKSVSRIELDSKAATINEDALRRRVAYSWNSGPFEAAFRDLNSVSSDLATLPIETAITRLASDVASSEKSVSVLGFSIPRTQLVPWGIVVFAFCAVVSLCFIFTNCQAGLNRTPRGWM